MDERGLLLVALALATVAVGVQGQTAEPDAPDEVPWWGPEDFDEGWTLRAPVVVENTWEYPIENAPVRVDLDAGSLADEAGWPTGKVGGDELLKTFTLQPEATRVVSYTNFQIPRTSPSDASLETVSPDRSGPDRHTVPARVVKTFLEETPPGPFDATANPILSVRFVAEGEMEPGETRHFMVYLEVSEHGEQEAGDEDRVRQALADRHWISRGHETYGVGQHARVSAPFDGTEVSVYKYDRTQPTLAEIEGPNPFTLSAGETRSVFLGSDEEPFRIRADKPVVASGQGHQSNENRRNLDLGFVPSVDGTLRGTEFDTAVTRGEYFVYATSPAGAGGKLNGESFHTEGKVTPIEVSGHLKLSVDEPILVQGELGHRRHQFASPMGAPLGDRLLGTYHGVRTVNQVVHDSGTVRIGSMDEEAAVRGRTTDDDPRTVIPEAGSGSLTVGPGEPVIVEGRDGWGHMPLELGTDGTASEDAGSRSMFAFGGMPNKPLSSPIGGRWAREFVGPADAHVFAFYDRTRLEVTEEGDGTRTTVLQRGERLEFAGSPANPFHLETSKPVAVVPASGVDFGPGRLASLSAEIGSLQYRGHLVALSPADGGEEPVVETTTFGETVTYEFVVENRGRDTDGGNLPDTIELSHSPAPPGWNVSLHTEEVELDSGQNRTVKMTVRPPETMDEDARLKLEVRAASESNPEVETQVQVVTLLRQRRDVGIWYHEAGGPQSLTVAFDPGEERVLPVVVENEGSAPDRISLRRTTGEVGWSARLADEGDEVDGISLGAGEARELDLVVQAPPRGALALPTSFSISAASTNDTSATDKVLFEGLLLAESEISLDTPSSLASVRPGENVTFPLALANDGNASADVELNASLSAPAWWGTTVFRHDGESLAPVGNRLSSVPPTGDDPVQLDFEVPVPPNASGRQSLKVLVTAKTSGGSGGSTFTLPLNVFVEPVVELDVWRVIETVVPPGGSSPWSFDVTNRGNVNATLDLLPDRLPPGWTAAHPALVRLGENETKEVAGTFTAPVASPAENATVGIEIGLPNGTSRTVDIPVSVPSHPRLELGTPGSLTAIPGQTKSVTLDVRNDGNRPGPVSVETDAPEGWRVATVAPNEDLQPRQRRSLHVVIEPPRETGEGTTNVTIAPTTEERGRGLPAPPAATLTVRTTVPDLRVLEASTGAVDRSSSRTGFVTATVVNEGETVAENVTVGLLDGETVLANTTLSRMPPSSPRSAVLELPAGAGSATALSVVVDPGDRFPETSEDNNAAEVSPGETVQTPAAGAVVATVAALASAWTVRRRGFGGDRRP